MKITIDLLCWAMSGAICGADKGGPVEAREVNQLLYNNLDRLARVGPALAVNQGIDSRARICQARFV